MPILSATCKNKYKGRVITFDLFHALEMHRTSFLHAHVSWANSSLAVYHPSTPAVTGFIFRVIQSVAESKLSAAPAERSYVVSALERRNKKARSNSCHNGCMAGFWLTMTMALTKPGKCLWPRSQEVVLWEVVILIARLSSALPQMFASRRVRDFNLETK